MTARPPLVDEVVHRRLVLDTTLAPAVAERAGLRALARDVAPLLPGRAIEQTVGRVEARLRGLGPLEPLVDDPQVTELMVNGDGAVWVEQAGVLRQTDVRLDEATVLTIIERVLAPLGLHVDRASPVADARLPDGSRVHAILPPLSVDGPCLTVRRFAVRALALGDLCEEPVADLLARQVRRRSNIVVCGGAGAGKTTLLNALASAIPSSERVITVEDTAELRLPGPHVVRLEARVPNAEGIGEVRVRDLVRTALRMRPDRIVVGEIRGGEALDMLQAMNTGHDGSLSTCHANGPRDALRRIETLVLMGDVALPLAAVREQIASAVDLVVHMGRLESGRRSVTAVDEVAVDLGQGGVLGTRPLAREGRLLDEPSRSDRGASPGADRWEGA